MLITEKWDEVLKEEMKKQYFIDLMRRLDYEYSEEVIFPPQDKIFEALKLTDFDDVRVVIIGQDPYHGKGQANGLAFAVNNGVRMPPSLANIFTELSTDLKVPPPTDTSLLGWAQQGVLLLNSTLTVREGVPLSHSNYGWANLTDAVISALNERLKPVGYILWGSAARQKAGAIRADCFRACSVHPSPLSAHRGFFGSCPFSKINSWLKTIGQPQIDWQHTYPYPTASYYGGKITVVR